MAKTQKPAGAAEGMVKVRVLAECSLGQCNDVVEIDAALLGQLVGKVDAASEAVAYAESLTAGAQ